MAAPPKIPNLVRRKGRFLWTAPADVRLAGFKDIDLGTDEAAA
jgi:hypothetical protein